MADKTGNDMRSKANPEAKDLRNPREVWEDGAIAPSLTPGEPETGPLGRVADPSTLGQGATSPYGTEIEAEIVGGQTKRDRATGPATDQASRGSDSKDK